MKNTSPPATTASWRQDASFALRIPEEVLDELRAVAVRNDRSAAAEARRAIAAHLDHERGRTRP